LLAVWSAKSVALGGFGLDGLIEIFRLSNGEIATSL